MCLPLTSGALCGSFGLKTICSFGGLEKAGDAVTAFRLARCGCEALALSVVPVALLFTAMHADVRPHVREAVQTLPPRILWLFLKVFFCFFLVFNYFSSAVDPPPPYTGGPGPAGGGAVQRGAGDRPHAGQEARL